MSLEKAVNWIQTQSTWLCRLTVQWHSAGTPDIMQDCTQRDCTLTTPQGCMGITAVGTAPNLTGVAANDTMHPNEIKPSFVCIV